MTKEEMFDWLVNNNVQIMREPPMKWTKPSGETFTCNFTMSANNTQYPAFASLEEAILFANNFEK